MRLLIGITGHMGSGKSFVADYIVQRYQCKKYRLSGKMRDIATELLIKVDGDEGLFLRYNEVEFKAPVFAGDYIEATGTITKKGNTSRTMEFNAYKVIEARRDISDTAADFLDEPILVTRATGVCVTPEELKRKK